MTKPVTAQSRLDDIHTSLLVTDLRKFIDSRYPGINNQQLYEAVVDVYASVVRDNNRSSVEQVQSALSAVYKNTPPVREVETKELERQQELGMGI